MVEVVPEGVSAVQLEDELEDVDEDVDEDVAEVVVVLYHQFLIFHKHFLNNPARVSNSECTCSFIYVELL